METIPSTDHRLPTGDLHQPKLSMDRFVATESAAVGSFEPDRQEEASAETTTSQESILDAISAIAKLAATDTSEYQTAVLRRSPRNKTSLDESLHRLLDEQTTNLMMNNGTPIASLTQSIHRFHSSIALLHQESDQQAAEIMSLQQTVVSLQKRNHALEQDVSALRGKNNKLVGKLKHRAQEKKCLVDHVKSFVRKAQASEQQQKELEEIREAYQLQTHENFLLHSNRSRAVSADSNLTDGLEFLDETETTYSSASSLVTDEGVATLKLSATAAIIHPDNSSSGNTVSSYDSNTLCEEDSLYQLHSRPAPYTLSFPRGTKVGILIRSLPLESESRVSTQQHRKPNEDLTNALLEDCDQCDSSQAPESRPQHSNPFALKFNINPFHRSNNNNTSKGQKNHQSSTDNHRRSDEQPRQAHIVSGYSSDFDETRNTKPALGARIVAINNVPVPETCSLKDLLESLQANSKADLLEGDDDTYTVTFRNDPLSLKERETLNISENDKEEEEKRSTDGEDGDNADTKTDDDGVVAKDTKAGFHFGFMKFGQGMGVGGEKKRVKISPSVSTDESEASREECKAETGHKPEDRRSRDAKDVLQFWKQSKQEGEAESDEHDPDI